MKKRKRRKREVEFKTPILWENLYLCKMLMHSVSQCVAPRALALEILGVLGKIQIPEYPNLPNQSHFTDSVSNCVIYLYAQFNLFLVTWSCYYEDEKLN